MTEAVSLRQLSERAGVDIAHLKRMIRVGSLPEATREVGADGRTWVIPSAALDDVISRNGWTIAAIDLTESSGGVGSVSLVPRADTTPSVSDSLPLSAEEISVAEIVDSTLLDRLLGAHEERADAEARARESQRTITTMASNQQRMVRELAEERYERQRTSDRLRDERSARQIADAKMAELRRQVDREVALTESEREAREAATRRSLMAEREAAAALASMSWLSRRRFQHRLQESRDRLHPMPPGTELLSGPPDQDGHRR